jgi:hypothetical protein
MTPYSISFQKVGSGSPFILVAGQHFRFDIAQFERFFQQPIPGRLVDLLRIASAIYFVDRLVRRRRRDQQRHWSRSLKVSVGVLEPDFWAGDIVRECLTDTIEFLSDDTWDLSFSHDDQRINKEVQRPLFPIPSDARVSLYSGGLDSAAGLANCIACAPSRHELPVTVWHQPIQRKIINKQFELLGSKGDVCITPLVVKAAMIWTPELKSNFRAESSQRGRAFLFAAAGGAASAMLGGSNVELFESGIGAINLPLMSGMVGSRTTRSTHPAFLRRMSQLLGLVLERPMQFDLPFFQQTKGQVVQPAKDAGLDGLAQLTVSCVHYPLRESRHKQCGVCPACIFRRQSLETAEITEPRGTYKHDLLDVMGVRRIPDRRLKYLKAFLDQVVQLDDIQADLPFPQRFRRHLVGTGVVVNGESMEPIGSLLSTYRDEWRKMITQAQERGIRWTKLVGCHTPSMEGASHAVV